MSVQTTQAAINSNLDGAKAQQATLRSQATTLSAAGATLTAAALNSIANGMDNGITELTQIQAVYAEVQNQGY